MAAGHARHPNLLDQILVLATDDHDRFHLEIPFQKRIHHPATLGHKPLPHILAPAGGEA